MADPIDRLRIATPCSVSWNQMDGDERVRHCAVCSLNVYNFAGMTRDEVRALLARSEGRVCARLYRRADGTVLTRDCPTGLRALRRRASRAAAAAVAAILSLPAFAFGGTSPKKQSLGIYGSEVKLTTEQAAAAQQAVFAGVVTFKACPLFLINHADTSLEAFGPEGRLWTTGAIASGGFRGFAVNDGTLAFEARQADGGWVEVGVEVEAGNLKSGP